MKTNILLHISLLAFTIGTCASPWIADQADGTYHNPILYADYSDPDVIRVGEDFFMTASSFNSVPALPILHSKDLVNWELVNYAVKRFPESYYDIPQHGNGVWAPSIRYHNHWYYIYWGDPDRGIFRVKTQDPFGEWETPTQVSQAYGNIDSCPFWDDDGKVYLVHAFANSRAGLKSTLQVAEMTPDGAELTSNKRVVYTNHEEQPTMEGPKFYKRNGYYYIFAPAGGVPTGWQTVLRSKNVWGPWEDKIVMSQGSTPINGPHQGGYVELENGEGWFIHFQEQQPYGRILHLQPVKWVDDWPVMGEDPDDDGCGEPVLDYAKPTLPTQTPTTPVVGDEFDNDSLSLAWQWLATPYPGWFNLEKREGNLRLKAVYPEHNQLNLWTVPQLLLQKFPAPEFTTETRLDPTGLLPGERGGLVVMGLNYATITLNRTADNQLQLCYHHCIKADQQNKETLISSIALPDSTDSVTLKCVIQKGGLCHFEWKTDDGTSTPFEQCFQAVEGRWIGAKIGIFAQKDRHLGEQGWIDFDYFRVE